MSIYTLSLKNNLNLNKNSEQLFFRFRHLRFLVKANLRPPYKKLIKKIILNFTIIFLLNSCRWMFHPLTMDMTVPDGPPEYRAGWHDGCSSALSSGGFHASKFHKFTMGNGMYQHDPVYQSAWSSAWFSCATQAGDYQSFPGMNSAPFE